MVDFLFHCIVDIFVSYPSCQYLLHEHYILNDGAIIIEGYQIAWLAEDLLCISPWLQLTMLWHLILDLLSMTCYWLIIILLSNWLYYDNIRTWRMPILGLISWWWQLRMENQNESKLNLMKKHWKNPWKCLGICSDPTSLMLLTYLFLAGGVTGSNVVAIVTTPSSQIAKLFKTLRFTAYFSICEFWLVTDCMMDRSVIIWNVENSLSVKACEYDKFHCRTVSTKLQIWLGACLAQRIGIRGAACLANEFLNPLWQCGSTT